jgi:hypothetical protein
VKILHLEDRTHVDAPARAGSWRRHAARRPWSTG